MRASQGLVAQRLKQRNEQLQRDIDELRTNPQAIERLARENFVMARPDEIVILFPRHSATSPADESVN